MVEDVVPDLQFDAIILDMPVHSPAISACSQNLVFGGRLACYAPTTSQLEACWKASEEAGLTVEWAGELMERQWGLTSKGGNEACKRSIWTYGFLVGCPEKMIILRLLF